MASVTGANKETYVIWPGEPNQTLEEALLTFHSIDYLRHLKYSGGPGYTGTDLVQWVGEAVRFACQAGNPEKWEGFARLMVKLVPTCLTGGPALDWGAFNLGLRVYDTNGISSETLGQGEVIFKRLPRDDLDGLCATKGKLVTKGLQQGVPRRYILVRGALGYPFVLGFGAGMAPHLFDPRKNRSVRFPGGGNAAGKFLAGVEISLNMTPPGQSRLSDPARELFAACRRGVLIHALQESPERSRAVVAPPDDGGKRRYQDKAWRESERAALARATDAALGEMYALVERTDDVSPHVKKACRDMKRKRADGERGDDCLFNMLNFAQGTVAQLQTGDALREGRPVPTLGAAVPEQVMKQAPSSRAPEENDIIDMTVEDADVRLPVGEEHTGHESYDDLIERREVINHVLQDHAELREAENRPQLRLQGARDELRRVDEEIARRPKPSSRAGEKEQEVHVERRHCTGQTREVLERRRREDVDRHDLTKIKVHAELRQVLHNLNFPTGDGPKKFVGCGDRDADIAALFSRREAIEALIGRGEPYPRGYLEAALVEVDQLLDCARDGDRSPERVVAGDRNNDTMGSSSEVPPEVQRGIQRDSQDLQEFAAVESAKGGSMEETKHDTVGGEVVQKVTTVEGWLESLRPGYGYLYRQPFADAGLDSVGQVKGLSSGDITRLLARLGGAPGSKPLHIRVVQRAIEALGVAPRNMDDQERARLKKERARLNIQLRDLEERVDHMTRREEAESAADGWIT